MLKGMCRKDIIFIESKGHTMGGTMSEESTYGAVALDGSDSDFIPRGSRLLHPAEVPPTTGGAVPAVIIGHELGHALYNIDDPLNVILWENPLRVEYGLPPRLSYHDVDLFSADETVCGCDR
jgi:hypothetical protein